ncbi:uncharacterized protein LOC109615043 [Esox lucius]|uniref:uncharacterized protein LOC109615043 n=1 Tax=Esox lucius TaxID=8010 RepID=UPI00147783CB|nr:uncharacterized protein LOC109615043 [Esox lucius]XP_034146455.1 uncharacterized protein LOC109615043 [Esox lucius]
MPQTNFLTSGAGLSLLGNSRSFNLLANIESWEEGGSSKEENTGRFMVLLLLKVVLDHLFLTMCLHRLHTSFMGVCSLSVILADAVLAFSVAAVWFLGPTRSPVTVCFLLVHASQMFNMLPLPVLVLGLLDYAFETRYFACRSAPCKALWSCTLTLLLWVLAAVRSWASAVTGLIEVEYEGGRTILGCMVQDSALVQHFCMGVVAAITCVLLLHYRHLNPWLKEANRLLKQRREVDPSLLSDLSFRHADIGKLEADEEKALVDESEWQKPPLYLSMTLGFGTMWASYLLICISSELLGLRIPAYISVNVLWFECTNSLLVGLVFWVKSVWLGTFTDLPDDICQWQDYWHLSRGPIRNFRKQPKTVFGLSGKDRKPLHV